MGFVVTHPAIHVMLGCLHTTLTFLSVLSGAVSYHIVHYNTYIFLFTVKISHMILTMLLPNDVTIV